MSLFDSYVDPDIPGVFTSVTDNSIAQETESNVRKVLIISPSKFGDDTRIMSFSDTEQLSNTLGNENSFKYGKGQFYAKELIKAGATVLFKRIDDEKASYANLILYTNPDTSTGADAFVARNFSPVYDKDTLVTPDPTGDATIEAIKADTVFSLLAKGRGKGYNDLFTVFSSAEDYEKFEADDEGIVNYKFNFINGAIYENGSEVVKKSNTILFSLMDIDPTSKNIISHKTNGSTLHVNSIYTDSNSYMTAQINDLYIDEMRKYPNLDGLLTAKNKPFLFIESNTTVGNTTLSVDSRVFYEVQVNDSVSPAQFRIQRATFTPNRQYTHVPTFKIGSQAYVLSILDTNGSLSIKADAITLGGNTTYADGEETYIDGDKAFYTFKLEDDGAGNPVIKTEIFKFLRWELYNYLMTYNMMLAGGEDSDSLSSNGFVKADGSANTDAIANAIYAYIRDDKEIREVIYPKHIFNYMIDWTGSVKVKDIMFILADRLRRTMHIASCPSVRLNSTGLSQDLSYENDVICREQYLTRSSYNTMLYSSQHNKNHYDADTKLVYKLPSCFYAILDHIYTDADENYGITEPVANVDKGIIRTTNLKLSHELYSEDIAALRKLQINCIVTDGEDNYFIDQKTAYKKTSKLSLGNVVKTLQYLQVEIPRKLKPYIQKKETDVAITSNVLNTIQEILKPYKTSTNSKDAIFKSVTVKTSFDDNILTIMLRVTPAGTTEKIQVPIIVEG